MNSARPNVIVDITNSMGKKVEAYGLTSGPERFFAIDALGIYAMRNQARALGTLTNFEYGEGFRLIRSD